MTFLDGDQHNNFIFGTIEDDFVRSFESNDSLIGSAGNDNTIGNESDDFLLSIRAIFCWLKCSNGGQSFHLRPKPWGSLFRFRWNGKCRTGTICHRAKENFHCQF